MLYSPVFGMDNSLDKFFQLIMLQANTLFVRYGGDLNPIDISYSEDDHYIIVGKDLISRFDDIINMSQYYTLRGIYFVERYKDNYEYYKKCEEYSFRYPGIFKGFYDTDLKTEDGQVKILNFLGYSHPVINPDYNITQVVSTVSVDAISGSEYYRRMK